MRELTDKIVADLKPKLTRAYIERDKFPGFFVVVGKRTKTFTVQCDVKDELERRRTKKVARGCRPDISVKQARAKGRRLPVRIAPTHKGVVCGSG